MRVEVNVLESGTDPGVSVQHQPALMMALRTGSIEVGSRRSEMMRFTFGAGEMCLVPRHGVQIRHLQLDAGFKPGMMSDLRRSAARSDMSEASCANS